MLARCARCQQTFATETFGAQRCPLCGAEIHLADPAAPPAAASPPPPVAPPPPSAPAWGAAPPPQSPGWIPPPPQTGWGPPPGQAPPPPGWGPVPPGAAGPPPPGDGEPSPFADRARLGFFPAWAHTWKLVALEPARFFRAAQVRQPGSAVLFGFLGATLGMWVAAAFGQLTAAASMAAARQILGQLPIQGGTEQVEALLQTASGASFALNVVIAPVLALAFIYLGAALLHVALLVISGAPRGFDSTLTVVGYAAGIGILQAVPMCGGLIAIVWFAVAVIIGLTESQRVPSWKPALAVIGPVVLSVCACACLVALGMGAILKGVGAGGATSL